VDDPMVLFESWRAGAELEMVLSTASASGEPSARTVLLKGVDHGFVFFTNHASRKAADLAANPRAALVFRWPALARQVTVRGTVGSVTDAESDAYFATRPVGSQLGAWASRQSEVLADRSILEQRVAEVAARFAGQPIPRPDFWGGYRVVPVAIEFWQGRDDRLHDRVRYRRAAEGEEWIEERIYP
jgi:pyridoxamine 5'-phosphate oxidase